MADFGLYQSKSAEIDKVLVGVEVKTTVKITPAQRIMMAKYRIRVYDDPYDTLLAISDKIFKVGFLPGDDYDLLNPTGLKLQKLYDELYEQNKYGDIEDER